MITLRIGYTALPYGPSYALRGVTLRTGPIAGSLSLRLRAQTARHMPVLVCALRSAPSSPMGLSYALRGVTLRTGPMAGSLSLRLRAQTARHMPVLVCALRSAPSSPMGLSYALRIVTLRRLHNARLPFDSDKSRPHWVGPGHLPSLRSIRAVSHASVLRAWTR